MRLFFLLAFLLGPIESKATALEAPTPMLKSSASASLNSEGNAFLPPDMFAAQLEKDVMSRSIVWTAGGRWPNPGRIDFCWVNPDDHRQLVADYQMHLSSEFSRAGIGFNFQGKCSNFSQPNQIRAWLKPAHDCKPIKSGGGGVSYIGPVNAPLNGENGPGTMMLAVCKNANSYPDSDPNKEWFKRAQLATAVHETGHAVGLAHEQDRADAPACNDQRGNLPSGGNYFWVGKYDAQSIMNYCRSGVDTATLSQGDIDGIRYLYPNAGQPSGSVTIRNQHSGKCLDLDNSGTANGTKVQNWSCNGTSAQSFWIQNLGGGWVNLVNTKSGKCLDVPSSSTANGTKIQLYDCNKTNAQAFLFEPRDNGYARIKNRNSNKCLDLTDWASGDGTRIQQWDCGEGNNQRFGFFTVR